MVGNVTTKVMHRGRPISVLNDSLFLLVPPWASYVVCIIFLKLYDYVMLGLQCVSMNLNEICSPTFKLFETVSFANNAYCIFRSINLSLFRNISGQ